MKTLNQLTRVAIVATAIPLLSSCSKSPASSITSILNECADIGHKSGRCNDPSAQANFVASSFQRLDVTSCPADFRIAFQDHINAWQQASEAFAGNTAGTAFLEGLTSGLTQDPSYLGQANQQANLATQRINETYYTLTGIAAKYGAKIPRSVVGE